MKPGVGKGPCDRGPGGCSPGARWLALLCGAAAVLLSLSVTVPVPAADGLSFSGRLKLRGIVPLDSDSVEEDPSVYVQTEIDARKSAWRLHTRLEGAWDGSVRDPQRDHSILKSFDEVYQDNTPYLEIRELYAEWAGDRLEARAGIQRFSWGRLDEYPVNDLFNPWDYTQFLVKPIEERKIGVPAVLASWSRAEWMCKVVWVPWLIPYRLPKINERWSPVPERVFSNTMPDGRVNAREPRLPARKLENGSVGLRVQRMGEIEWAVNLFQGYDPRPVFKTTRLRVRQADEEWLVDPGFLPSFHKIISVGLDGASVYGDWSLRGEAAFTLNRVFNVHYELWGYPKKGSPGEAPLNPVEVRRDGLDYGLAADYRLFEDGLLTLQAQQTIIFAPPSTLVDRAVETLLWANLKVGWMNQKIETSLNAAYNPEHGATLFRPSVHYTFNDSWKAGVMGLFLSGPPRSIFGRYGENDQIEMAVTYLW